MGFIEDRNRVYSRYHRSINMSLPEYRAWVKSKCSRKASLDRSPIKRNLELLKTRKSQWTRKHIRWANKTIGFIARHREGRKGKAVSIECPFSKRTIALRNWVYDPLK